MTPLFHEHNINYYPNCKDYHLDISLDYWLLKTLNVRSFQYSTGELLDKYTISRHQLLSIVTQTAYVDRKINCEVCKKISTYEAYTRAEARDNRIGVDRTWDRNVCQNCRDSVIDLESNHAIEVLNEEINYIKTCIEEDELGIHHKYETILLKIFAKASVYAHLKTTKGLLGYDNAFEVMIERLNDLNLIKVEKTAYGRITNLEMKDYSELPIKYYGVETDNFSEMFRKVESPVKHILDNSKKLSSFRKSSSTKKINKTGRQKSVGEQKPSGPLLKFHLNNHSSLHNMNPKFLNVVNFKDKMIISPDESYVIIGDQKEDGLQITMVPLSSYSK